jgi:hypothetical protein
MNRQTRAAIVAPLTSLMLAALAPVTARAEDASSQAAAQALFEDARKLASDGKYAEACPKFAESERLDPGAGTLMNLADCYEKNGQTASAWVTFKDAAAAADEKHRADWAMRARQRSAALDAKLSRLTIDVPAAHRVDGMVVRRDGGEVGPAEWGVAIPSDPGEHTVQASAPHKKGWSGKVTVPAGAAQARVDVPRLEDEPPPEAPVALTPAPAPAPAPVAPPAPPASDGSSQRAMGLVVGGVGIVGVALGTVFGLRAISDNKNAKSLCPQDFCASAAGVQDNSDAKSAATVSTVAMIAGVAGVAGGAILYLTAPKGAPRTGIHLSPQLAPGVAGLRIGGAW